MCFVYIFRKQIACRCVLFEYWIYLKLISKQSNQTPHPIRYSISIQTIEQNFKNKFVGSFWTSSGYCVVRLISDQGISAKQPHFGFEKLRWVLLTIIIIVIINFKLFLNSIRSFIYPTFCRGVGKSLSCYVAFSLIKCCWKLSTFPWCYPSPCVLLLVPFFMVLRKQQRFSSIWVSANWMNDKKSFINNPVDTKKFPISTPFSALGFSTIYNASWCYPEYVHICWAR